MKQVIGHIAQANSEYKHPFLVERADVKRVGYIIVSTDRGLAGGLNSNLFRRMLADMREWQAAGRRGRRRHHRPEGDGVLPPPQGQHARLGHAPGRQAAARAAGRRHQGDARRLPGRPRRPRVPRLQRLRQHHDAEGDVRPAAAAAGVGNAGRQARLGLPVRARRRRPCSTTC